MNKNSTLRVKSKFYTIGLVLTSALISLSLNAFPEMRHVARFVDHDEPVTIFHTTSVNCYDTYQVTGYIPYQCILLGWVPNDYDELTEPVKVLGRTVALDTKPTAHVCSVNPPLCFNGPVGNR